MKRMLFLGALVLGVTVCSQSFGFEILDRMLGGHKSCTSCCEPDCGAGNGGCSDACEPACGAGNGCAEPACGAGNGCAEPACDAGNGCCEPACDAGNGCCKQKRCKKHVIKDLLRACHEAKKKHCHRQRSCCSSCCDAGEPDCGAGNGCCEPACGAEAPVEAPAAPTPDASASKKAPNRVIAVSRTVSAK